jgi:hypothetical protein
LSTSECCRSIQNVKIEFDPAQNTPVISLRRGYARFFRFAWISHGALIRADLLTERAVLDGYGSRHSPAKTVFLSGKARSAGENLSKASCKRPPSCDSLPALAENQFLSRAPAG